MFVSCETVALVRAGACSALFLMSQAQSLTLANLHRIVQSE